MLLCYIYEPTCFTYMIQIYFAGNHMIGARTRSDEHWYVHHMNLHIEGECLIYESQ